MRKIPTLYERDEQDRRYVTDTVTPGCEWVFTEGVPTRKHDGTCVMLDTDNTWWSRREVKPGKPAPPGFRPVHHDETTGKTQGWVPIESSPFARWFIEAPPRWVPGTYELVGERINGNPDKVTGHRLMPHGAQTLAAPGELSPLALIAGCRTNNIEGVVWHHPDGRMAKLKVKDVRS